MMRPAEQCAATLQAEAAYEVTPQLNDDATSCLNAATLPV